MSVSLNEPWLVLACDHACSDESQIMVATQSKSHLLDKVRGHLKDDRRLLLRLAHDTQLNIRVTMRRWHLDHGSRTRCGVADKHEFVFDNEPSLNYPTDGSAVLVVGIGIWNRDPHFADPVLVSHRRNRNDLVWERLLPGNEKWRPAFRWFGCLFPVDLGLGIILASGRHR